MGARGWVGGSQIDNFVLDFNKSSFVTVDLTSDSFYVIHQLISLGVFAAPPLMSQVILGPVQ